MDGVLPDDLLADVLGRLPPSSLAASRCVRKHWRAIIDARHLLMLADLLPLRLDAFYCISLDHIERMTYLLARPGAARRLPGGALDFLAEAYSIYLAEVEDHCNGLLLLGDCYMVANHATRQWATLPEYPEPSMGDVLGGVTVWANSNTGTTTTTETDQPDPMLFSSSYLVYDPINESPHHFEVFVVPNILAHGLLGENITIDLEEQQWPPSTLRTHVFSSRRWRWEERSWTRQGEPAGTMADMLRSKCRSDRKAVYFRGALYVHCQNDSVIRIALSNDKYQMVTPPPTVSKLDARNATSYLRKSEKGVYSALLYWVGDRSCPQFQVWWLKEEQEINDDGNHIIHMEWVLKANISLPPLKLPFLHGHSLADDGWRIIYDCNNKEEVPPAADAHGDDEWDFDNADIVLDEAKDNKAAQENGHYPVDFLGFHPYKEIAFFSLKSWTISYNLNTSKVQQLGGNVCIPVGMRTCFPYTPCWLTLGGLFENS